MGKAPYAGGAGAWRSQQRYALKVHRQQNRNFNRMCLLTVVIGVAAWVLSTPELRGHAPLFTRSPRPALSPLEAERLGIHWHAPFFSGGGYCSEAINFVKGLSKKLPMEQLAITQHGDSHSHDFSDGLPKDLKGLLFYLSNNEQLTPEGSIVVCHSEPGAWAPSLYQTSPCPEDGPAYYIGRTMFETDRISPGWVQRCNEIMDEVWVPTEFHRDTFSSSGVDPAKLVVVPEAVDCGFWNVSRKLGRGFRLPDRSEDRRLPCPPPSSLDGPDGEKYKEMCARREGAPAPKKPRCYAFLSVFKWEHRKGWDILVEAFLREFDARFDNVCLYIKTSHFHSTLEFEGAIEEFAEELQLPATTRKNRAPIRVISEHVAEERMPALYKAADSVVIPSRGEGWGRPHVEAMAMSRPLIATNWSGPTAFMTDDNSYPLKIDGMDTIEKGAWRGHKWARPSVTHLRQLMRHVYEHPEEATEKAARGRKDMEEKFDLGPVTQQVLDRIAIIKRKVSNQQA